MLKANINNDIILCPTCNEQDFTIFRRDKMEEETFLNHCKCKKCGELFVFKVDRLNKIIID